MSAVVGSAGVEEEAVDIGDVEEQHKKLAHLRLVHAELSKTLGPHHKKTIAATVDLSECLGELGAFEQEQALLRGVLPGCQKALGSHHDSTLRVARSLATSLMYDDDDDEASADAKLVEAEAVLRDALRAATRVNGPDHTTTRSLQANLDHARRQRGPLRTGALGGYREEAEAAFSPHGYAMPPIPPPPAPPPVPPPAR